MKYLYALALFLLPTLALAADTTFIGSIVPQCPGTICRACDLVTLADNIIRFMVMLAVFVATLMFAYAGFLYVTASANKANIETAKKVFSSVFLGLIFILTAWLIIDLSLRVLTGTKDLNVLTQIQCVDFVGASATNPTGYQQSPGVTPSVNNPVGNAQAGKGLSNVDSNTNYNPIACKVITNYSTASGGSCEGMQAAGYPGARGQECLQGCVGSANGKRIITVADYQSCNNNPGGSIAAVTQSGSWGNYPAMQCSTVLANGVTIATPQRSGISAGQKFTWPELARRYGLPPETVFTADDSYGVTCPGGRKCGYTSRGTYSIDVARCGSWNTNCNLPSFGGTVPMQTKPTPVGGG